MKRKQRKTIFALAMAVCVLCLAELITFVSFSIFHERFTFHEVDQYLLREDYIEGLQQKFDARYGWDHRYDTPLTERPRPVVHDRPLLATFGDSYTHCSDVEDDETWQTYCADLLDGDVYNFGTSGFGTDQAYLKYLELKQSIETPIVALGLISENINRVVNVYRPFYFRKTGIRLPKPRFVLDGRTLTLIENPLKSADDIDKLTDENFIRSLGRHDYWYNRDNHPIRRFPYLRILFNKRIWLEAFYGKNDKRIGDVNPRPWEDLWTKDHATDLIFAILGSFVDDVRADGRTPIIMIMPLQNEAFEKLCTGNDPDGAAMIELFCERRQCLCFNAIDAIARSVESSGGVPEFIRVHLTPMGNRAVARALYEFIQEHKLLPAGGATDGKRQEAGSENDGG